MARRLDIDWPDMLARAVAQNMCAAELARALDCSAPSVTRAQKRVGIELPRKRYDPPRHSPFTRTTQIVREGILAALRQGEAGVREIEARMGFIPATQTLSHLRNMERQGLVRLVARVPNAKNRGGRSITIWALVQEKGRARA